MSGTAFSESRTRVSSGFLARLKDWFTVRMDDLPVDVLDTERSELGDKIQEAGGNWFGLSLSGGGIRSASFAMGLMQAVQDAGLIRRLHYLSTVSGGGYTGSSFTWFRRQGVPFPFGKRFEGGRTEEQSRAARILTYIRLYGDYLLPTRALGLLSAVGVVIWAMFWSLLIYGALLLATVIGLYAVLPMLLQLLPWVPGELQTPWTPWLLLIVAALMGGLLPVTGVFYVGATLFRSISYPGRRSFQGFVGVLLSVTLAAVALAAIPVLYDFLQDYVSGGLTAIGGASAFGVLSGVAAALYRLYKDVRGTLSENPWLSGPMVVAGSILLIVGMLLGTYALARAWIGDGAELPDILWRELVAVPALLLARMADLNRISFHALYRDRLMEVFMPEAAAYRTESWKPAKRANRMPLSETFSGPPYHIINANVILSGSENKEYRSRGGDNFILSPFFCGSDATGYQPTKTYLDNGMTLPTAMAISGAAVNPNSGVGGQGVTRNFWVSVLLSLLNVRLGYWVRHPEQLSGSGWKVKLRQFAFNLLQGKSRHPDFYNPGLASMIQGGGREDTYYVELSDGGHFDNTALYELIRRHLDVIVISDAGADPDFAFADLGNAIERARVDFGAEIRFPDPGLDLSGLIPKSGDNPILREKFDIARRGFAVGTIAYDRDHVGILLYVKPTMVSDLPGDIFAYRAAHAEFPHQPTSDQFFQENQLEAYRELGYQLATDALATLKVVASGGSPYFPPGAIEALCRFLNLPRQPAKKAKARTTSRAPARP